MTDRAESSQGATIALRDVVEDDLRVSFEHQLNAVANHVVAFTVADQFERQAFVSRWSRILSDDSIVANTILVDDAVAGHVVSFEQDGVREVSCWIDRENWGRGITTKALATFLMVETTRPLHARAAKDNTDSIRVLQKCGFTITGEDRGFANARGEEIDEYVLMLR